VLTCGDRLAIIAIYAEYNRAIDCGDVPAWLATWTADGVFEHPARRYTGCLELTRFVTDRNDALRTHNVVQQRHWNADVEVRDSSEGAQGSCLLLVAGVERVSGQPAVVADGRYEDSLVRQGGGWRFAHRRLVLTPPPMNTGPSM
jgi:hypothetical protein